MLNEKDHSIDLIKEVILKIFNKTVSLKLNESIEMISRIKELKENDILQINITSLHLNSFVKEFKLIDEFENVSDMQK